MWGDTFKAIQQWLPDENFVKPDASAVDGVPKMIPSTGGMSPSQATDLLEEAGFQVADGGMRDTGYPRGTVAYTNPAGGSQAPSGSRSEEHTSELQSLMRISYAVFCLKKKKQDT